jgi:hypothetical protein
MEGAIGMCEERRKIRVMSELCGESHDVAISVPDM